MARLNRRIVAKRRRPKAYLLPPNSPPVANPDTVNATAGVAQAFNVLTNDTDADGNTLTITSFTVGAQTAAYGQTITIANVGTLTIAQNGAGTFTPLAGFVGSQAASYVVSDGVATTTGTLTLNSAAAGPAVSAGAAITINAAPGQAYPFSVLRNATVSDFLPISVSTFTWDGVTQAAGTTITRPSYGALAVAANGQATFTPIAGTSGTVTCPGATFVVGDGRTTHTGILTLKSVRGVDYATPAAVMAAINASTLPDGTFANITGTGNFPAMGNFMNKAFATGIVIRGNVDRSVVIQGATNVNDADHIINGSSGIRFEHLTFQNRNANHYFGGSVRGVKTFVLYNAAEGIEWFNCDFTGVDGPDAYGNGNAINFEASSQPTTPRKCLIERCSISNQFRAIACEQVKNLDIVHNLIQGYSGNGIYISKSQNVTIWRNVIRNPDYNSELANNPVHVDHIQMANAWSATAGVACKFIIQYLNIMYEDTNVFSITMQESNESCRPAGQNGGSAGMTAANLHEDCKVLGNWCYGNHNTTMTFAGFNRLEVAYNKVLQRASDAVIGASPEWGPKGPSAKIRFDDLGNAVVGGLAYDCHDNNAIVEITTAAGGVTTVSYGPVTLTNNSSAGVTGAHVPEAAVIAMLTPR